MINGLALCAGIGGLELGLKLALGDRYRCVGYVERDTRSAAQLVAGMEATALDQAPIWESLTDFPGLVYRHRVDIVSAGIPCQPYSAAGKRLGGADKRDLVSHFIRAIREVGPSIVFLENVPLFRKDGLRRILEEMSDFGFDAEWDCFSASGVRAPHKRKRFFMVAWRVSDSISLKLWNESERGPGATQEANKGNTEPEHLGEEMAHGLWPPGPDADWSRIPEDAQPSVRRVVDGVPVQLDGERLRLLGNGVVPLVAAHAFRTLASRAKILS